MTKTLRSNLFWILILVMFLPSFVARAQNSDALEEIRRFAPAVLEVPEDAVRQRFRTLGPEDSGLNFVIPIDTKHPDKRLYYSAMACGSVATGDLDGDGWADLYFATGPVPNRLFRNTGESGGPRFEEISDAAGIQAKDSWCNGAVMIDIDGDGDLDIYVCRYDEPNLLFLNESTPGVFRFREAAAEWGLDYQDASLMPSFADYDRDGDLDLFLVTNAFYRKGGRPPEGVPMRRTATGWEVVEPWDKYFEFSSIELSSGSPKFTEVARANRFFRNDGGTFVDISGACGLLSLKTHTNAMGWFDYNGDGWLDMYVANDFSDRDELYLNQKDGTFKEVAPDVLQHTAWFSMGLAAEDLNNDGMTDLVVADMLPTTHYRQKVTMGEMGTSFDEMYRAGLPLQGMVNTFFVNTGTGRFFEAARIAGISKTDWTWAVKHGDLDGDGRVDLYFTTGHTRDFNHSDYGFQPSDRIGKDDWDNFESRPELREHDLVYRNAQDWKFQKMNEEWGLGLKETMNYGGALADFDRDGDLDMVTLPLEDSPVLYLNESAERWGVNHLLVQLRGGAKNRAAIGAKLTLTMPDGSRQCRTLLPHNGYQQSDEPLLHFGLGSAEIIAELVVDWPTGGRSSFKDVKAGRWIEISESPGAAENPNVTEVNPWFRAQPGFHALAGPEIPFDDFVRQPLLPHQHSQLGPGQAWGDVDGDGLNDVYLGGPKGQPGKMLLGRGLDEQGQPVFTMRMQSPFTEMGDYEDMGSLLIDVDGDVDLDLLVVSGSVECEPGAPSLADRLYLNDGKGAFTEVKNWLDDQPEDGYASGSVAAAADFDRDGDLDVFIGGRVVPGDYPLPARNQFLVNTGGGRFADEAVSRGLEKTGLVTSALWSDTDNDGWLDLLITHEWGPIRVFANVQGKLVDQTESAGLSGATGFWNSIAGRDLNGDGHIDYIAGNLGYNTKYSASTEVPEMLYYGDVDGSGKRNIVEVKPDPTLKCLLPRRGLSCSSMAMPNLLGKVNTYEGWATAALDEIYDPVRLNSALKLEATTLGSMALINDGEGHFTLHALPPMAQLAPVFGIAMSDFDGDGSTDVVLAQNFFTPQQETGAYDGGLGLLLRGATPTKINPAGLKEVWPLQSGIVVPGDAKSLGVTDFDKNAKPDLFFGMNNAPPAMFINDGPDGSVAPSLALELKGRPGNPTAIGARVTVMIPGMPVQAAEMTSASGYLSQSVPVLYFGWGTRAEKELRGKVMIRWPEGSTSETEITPKDGPYYRISEN
jgi:enediyne biosynthesis protein E4